MAPKGSESPLTKELVVSRGMLYYRHKQPDKDENPRRRIEAVMVKHPRYGHKRIADELKVSRKRARRVMKLYALKPARRARASSKPHDVGPPESTKPDILSKLPPLAPDAVWVAGFTYIWFHRQHVCLSTLMDRFTREVLGGAVMTEHSAELVARASTRPLLGAEAKPIWVHFVKGGEYTSYALTQLLARHGIQASHSPKSSPWRNGSQESFFGRFKVEFGDPERFSALPELMEAIYCHIAFYKAERIHTAHRTSRSTERATTHVRLTSGQQVMSLPHTPSRPCRAEDRPLPLI